MHHDAIAVIDFGGQYAHLIATKSRRHGVLAEIRQPENPIETSFGLKSLQLRSVGVKADLRAYEHPVLLSGDVSSERMVLAVSAITAKVPDVNRCVWNLAPGHPDSACPVAATVTRARLDVLRPVRSQRAVTATSVELPPAMRHELARDLLALAGVSGVLLDVTSRPPGTVEWE